MSVQKKIIHVEDLQHTLSRFQVPFSYHPLHPLRTVLALRLLHAVQCNSTRRTLAHRLYKAYWVENLDITDKTLLLQLVCECGITGVSMDTFDDKRWADCLSSATQAAVDHGAPGVPCFYLPEVLSII